MAKAAGVLWDKGAKSWYGARMPTGGIETLVAGNVLCQQGLAMTTTDEFAEALRSIGCVVSGTHPSWTATSTGSASRARGTASTRDRASMSATWTGTRPAT